MKNVLIVSLLGLTASENSFSGFKNNQTKK